MMTPEPIRLRFTALLRSPMGACASALRAARPMASPTPLRVEGRVWIAQHVRVIGAAQAGRSRPGVPAWRRGPLGFRFPIEAGRSAAR
jgi:hypothetical protein